MAEALILDPEAMRLRNRRNAARSLCERCAVLDTASVERRPGREGEAATLRDDTHRAVTLSTDLANFVAN